MQLVFFVLSPALVGSNLVVGWLLNVLIPFVIGSVLGWLLVKITKAPKGLRGVIMGCCAAGNLDKMLLVIVLAVCKEKGSPFGVSDVCTGNGMAYVSLSMAIGSLYIWSYVYNIVRIYSSKDSDEAKPDVLPEGTESAGEKNESAKCRTGPPLPSRSLTWRNFWRLFAPAIIGAIVGLMIGIIPPFRKVLIGDRAPLHAVEDSADMVGKAAIPIITLILGANLLKGLKGSKVPLLVIIGIVAIRYIILPILGVVIIKYAIHFRLVRSDPLYQFVLLLQFALPPANSVATMSQLFGVGQTECSVIMLWTNALATVSLTVWSTFFIWFVR
ncbi:protein PIN-LIKES 3 [Populus trichocarpa]|uniref:protein PIN-LIKES 3 n=1 Tax=Populus trichocarpa TaxID=3694 RepID=UPI0022799A63|nr:protein PIN-LIKES 3 [Populus trichocarpa]